MKNLFFLFLLLPIFGFNQQTVCDSITIDNIYVNVNNNQVELTATNNSSEFFPYPGWILFDDQQDTIAKETVNFFGFAGQTNFLLDIQSTLTLPFTGTLNLYSGFYDTLWCSKSVTIDSSMLSIFDGENYNTKAYPNPINNQCTIDLNMAAGYYHVELYNNSGQLVYRDNSCSGITILQRNHLPAGIYMLNVIHDDHTERLKLLFE